MSSYLIETGSLVLRLSGPDRERFIGAFAARLHEAYGIIQKEFVDVPDDLFAAEDGIAPWFRGRPRLGGGPEAESHPPRRLSYAVGAVRHRKGRAARRTSMRRQPR